MFDQNYRSRTPKQMAGDEVFADLFEHWKPGALRDASSPLPPPRGQGAWHTAILRLFGYLAPAPS